MGNLGRAGFGASLEGLVRAGWKRIPMRLDLTISQWPYSYDTCDVGALPNQTYPGTQTPLWAVQDGDPANNDMLVSFLRAGHKKNLFWLIVTKSYQPGQRLCMFLFIELCASTYSFVQLLVHALESLIRDLYELTGVMLVVQLLK